MHILSCINFYRTGDSFPEKDRQSLEVVTGWSHILKTSVLLLHVNLDSNFLGI